MLVLFISACWRDVTCVTLPRIHSFEFKLLLPNKKGAICSNPFCRSYDLERISLAGPSDDDALMENNSTILSWKDGERLCMDVCLYKNDEKTPVVKRALYIKPQEFNACCRSGGKLFSWSGVVPIIVDRPYGCVATLCVSIAPILPSVVTLPIGMKTNTADVECCGHCGCSGDDDVDVCVLHDDINIDPIEKLARARRELILTQESLTGFLENGGIRKEYADLEEINIEGMEDADMEDLVEHRKRVISEIMSYKETQSDHDVNIFASMKKWISEGEGRKLSDSVKSLCGDVLKLTHKMHSTSALVWYNSLLMSSVNECTVGENTLLCPVSIDQSVLPRRHSYHTPLYDGRSLFNEWQIPRILRSTCTGGYQAESRKFPGIHLVVCVHGFRGYSTDFLLISDGLYRYASMIIPSRSRAKITVYSPECNEDQNLLSISELGRNLMKDVLQYITNRCGNSRSNVAKLASLSFIGHSLGALVVRSCIAQKEWMDSIPNELLNTYVSLAGPHLGFHYHSNRLLDLGSRIYASVKGVKCLQELYLDDEAGYLRSLSQTRQFGMFSNYFIFSCNEDGYVPYHSSRIEVCEQMLSDVEPKSQDLVRMAHSLVSTAMDTHGNTSKKRFDRLDVNFPMERKGNSYDDGVFYSPILDDSIMTRTNALLKRTAHIAYVAYVPFVEQLCILLCQALFLEKS